MCPRDKRRFCVCQHFRYLHEKTMVRVACLYGGGGRGRQTIP